jgi:plastocyanin
VTTPNLSFAPATVTIQAGQIVTWQFSGAVHNVTWLPGPVPPLGDVLDQPIGSTVQRSFPTAGVYTYECTRHNNMTGQVIVQSGQAQVFSSVAVTPATAALLVGGTVQLTGDPLDQAGVPMTGLPAPGFTSGDPAIATVNGTGLVTAVGAGTVNITVTISSGGITHSATATMLVSAPVPGGTTVTTPNLTFAPPSVTIPAGGTVTWQFSGNTHNVTFTAAQPPGGNIPDQPAGSSQSRTFTTAGSYGYVCTRHSSMSGTVVVTGGTTTATYTALELTPQAPFVQLNGLVQLTATPVDQTGAPMTGLPGAVFASASTAVATVAPTGLVTGVGVGTTTITATLTARRNHPQRHLDGQRGQPGRSGDHHAGREVRSRRHRHPAWRNRGVAGLGDHSQHHVRDHRAARREHPGLCAGLESVPGVPPGWRVQVLLHHPQGPGDERPDPGAVMPSASRRSEPE